MRVNTLSGRTLLDALSARETEPRNVLSLLKALTKRQELLTREIRLYYMDWHRRITPRSTVVRQPVSN